MKKWRHIGLVCLVGVGLGLWLWPTDPTLDDRSPEPINLTVFAAASLTDAFTEIGQTFEAAHPEISVTFNFAGSQQLAQQLGQGAPADVFTSANTSQMGLAIEAGRVNRNNWHTLAHNQLVVIYPADNPAQLTSLTDLTQPDLRLVLAADEVPVGRYSLEFLEKADQHPAFAADFKAQVLNNVVSYEQNVKVVLTKVALGEGDAGIIYISDVTSEVAEQVGQLEIHPALNTLAVYPIAPLNDATYPAQAQDFVEYVLSPTGQQILARFGLLPRE